VQKEGRFSALERLSSSCNTCSESSLLVLGLTMTVIVIVQVFCRYILNHSLFWSEELARTLLVWLTFIGASVAYYRCIHPGIDIFYRRFSRRIKRYARIAVHGTSLTFFLVMVWYGSHFTYFVRLQTTPALSLPKWVIFLVIPVSGFILALHALAYLSKEFTKDRIKP